VSATRETLTAARRMRKSAFPRQLERESGCVASSYQQVTPADELILFAPHFLRQRVGITLHLCVGYIFIVMVAGLKIKTPSGYKLLNKLRKSLSLRKISYRPIVVLFYFSSAMKNYLYCMAAV
jgi:hypothetical protein